MRDVAQHADVSVKTVSRVVNREPHTRPEIIERVQRAIAELGWVPNHHARSLRSGRTDRVGIAVAELRRPYLAKLVESLVFEAAQHGLTATVEPTHRDNDRLNSTLSARGALFDGVVIIGSWHGESAPVSSFDGYPVVVVQGGRTTVGVDRVDDDVVGAIALMARHLGTMDRRRPVLLGGDRAADGRGVGGSSEVLRAALEVAGMGGDIPRIDVGHVADRAAGAAAAMVALHGHPDVDALLCTNDEVALGALASLSSVGVEVPGRVAVVGYDNLADGRFSTPTLTTIDPLPAVLARQAMRLLVDRIHGRVGPGPVAYDLPVELVRRESTMGR